MSTDKEYLKGIGRKIKEIREFKGISQTKAAHSVGMDRSSWTRIENGGLNLQVLTLLRVGRALGVDPYKLMESDPDDKITLKKEISVLNETKYFVYQNGVLLVSWISYGRALQDYKTACKNFDRYGGLRQEILETYPK